MTGCAKCSADVVQLAGSSRPRKFCLVCSPKNIYRVPPRSSVRFERCALSGCGALFVQRYFRKYCSDQCKTIATRMVNIEVCARLRPVDRSPRACKRCGGVVDRTENARRSEFCSTSCRRANRVGGDTYKRRMKPGAPYEHVDRLRVFNEYNWQCGICRVDSPRHLMGSNDPAAPELDHIVPLAAGGGHTRENVQLACRRCNRLKRDSVPTNSMRSGDAAGWR